MGGFNIIVRIAILPHHHDGRVEFRHITMMGGLQFRHITMMGGL